MEIIKEFFASGDVWTIVIKVLLTAIFTGLLGLIGTLLGRIIARHKNSKIYKYADACVKAAEQKFPNEGTKMGPEKMQYVMDQMMIKFPKIRDNQYLYNIAEAAVFELNEDKRKEAAIKEFEEKYGEKPLAVQEDEDNSITIEVEEEKSTSLNTSINNNTQTQQQSRQQQQTTTKYQNKIQSF